MLRLLKKKVNLSVFINPFYIFGISFSFAIVVYSWGWCDLYPRLTFNLILFLLLSSLIFMAGGYIFRDKIPVSNSDPGYPSNMNDVFFALIIILGLVDILYMGYLPIVDTEHNYRDFGMPVVDVLFNTLSIFFSVYYIQKFLDKRQKRLLIYVFVILAIQILLYRRSTIVWIVLSSLIVIILKFRKIPVYAILILLLSLPFLSYLFGLYGDNRSNLTRSVVISRLGPTDSFINSGISHHHYLTYLYISSPLANLQKNVDEGKGFLNRNDFRQFLFYSVIPESITMRLEKQLKLTKPICSLITPDLIVGSFFMIGYFTLGWPGISILVSYLFLLIVAILYIVSKWNTFSITSISLMCTAVSLLIFSNFFTRLDVLIMIFLYPVLFHSISEMGIFKKHSNI